MSFCKSEKCSFPACELEQGREHIRSLAQENNQAKRD
jgi:DNA-binding sugar fermentation-stimulating protein